MNDKAKQDNNKVEQDNNKVEQDNNKAEQDNNKAEQDRALKQKELETISGGVMAARFIPPSRPSTSPR